MNDCTACKAKAERRSLIRRNDEKDHWLFAPCSVPIGCACASVLVRVCLSTARLPVSVVNMQVCVSACCACASVSVCYHGVGANTKYEWAGLAFSRPNNRLQRVRGHLTLPNTLAELPTDARSGWTSHTHQQCNEDIKSHLSLFHILPRGAFSFLI